MHLCIFALHFRDRAKPCDQVAALRRGIALQRRATALRRGAAPRLCAEALCGAEPADGIAVVAVFVVAGVGIVLQYRSCLSYRC